MSHNHKQQFFVAQFVRMISGNILDLLFHTGVSEDEPVTGSELVDESELVEVLSFCLVRCWMMVCMWTTTELMMWQLV